MAKKEGEGEGSNGAAKDWKDDWFKEHGVTEDEDKSFLNSRALADEFVEASRSQRTPKPASKKRLFGGRAAQD